MIKLRKKKLTCHAEYKVAIKLISGASLIYFGRRMCKAEFTLVMSELAARIYLRIINVKVVVAGGAEVNFCDEIISERYCYNDV